MHFARLEMHFESLELNFESLEFDFEPLERYLELRACHFGRRKMRGEPPG